MTSRFATARTRAWLIAQLEPFRAQAQAYCEDAGMLLPTERLVDLPLRFVPVTLKERDAFVAAAQKHVARVGDRNRAPWPFIPHAEPDAPKPQRKRKRWEPELKL